MAKNKVDEVITRHSNNNMIVPGRKKKSSTSTLNDNDWEKNNLIKPTSGTRSVLDDIEKSFMKDIIDFFKNPKYMNILLSIVVPDNNHRVSLRALEWFVTNYCKKNGTWYKIKHGSVIELFSVYTDYKAKLKAYKKLYFDPFCRGAKINFSYNSSDGTKKILMTSISQLNFFKWAIKYKVIDYVQDHINEIEKDMKPLKTPSIISEESDETDGESNENGTPQEPIQMPDPEICSSENVNCINLSSTSSSYFASPTVSEKKKKRQELSTSIYKNIKKIDSPPKLYFN